VSFDTHQIKRTPHFYSHLAAIAPAASKRRAGQGRIEENSMSTVADKNEKRRIPT